MSLGENNMHEMLVRLVQKVMHALTSPTAMEFYKRALLLLLEMLAKYWFGDKENSENG